MKIFVRTGGGVSGPDLVVQVGWVAGVVDPEAAEPGLPAEPFQP
jgi:hypothetical protein